MKCEKCKKETDCLFTLDDNKLACRKCLEKSIYKERKRIKKKYRKKELE